MRKMSKYTSLFDKYGEVKEKDTGRGEKLGEIDWDGHIKLRGSFSGSAFISGYQHGFIATDLKSESNPRGSILQEAKNYTDSKTKYLHYHFITLNGSAGSVYVTYISEYANKYTIATLKNALVGKSLVCSGFLNGVAEYISSEGGNLVVGVRDVTDGSTTGETIDNTFSITDEVTPI